MARIYSIKGQTPPGDGFPPLAAFSIPPALRTGMILASFLGNGTIEDFSPARNPLNPVGSVVRTALGYQLSSTGYFRSPFVDPGAISIGVLFRSLEAVPIGIAGNLRFVSGTEAEGAGLWSANGDASLNWTAGRVGLGATGSGIALNANLAAWGIYMGRSSLTQNSRIDNLTAGTFAQNTTATGVTRDINAMDPVMVGTIPQTLYDGKNEVALAMVWNTYLSDVRMAEFATLARGYAASLGITA